MVDTAFAVVLCTIALVGFHATFSGRSYLVAGETGLLLGAALAVIAVRLGQPVIVLAVFVVATFFLVGGAAALHGLGGQFWLPVPDTLDQLAQGSIDGWKNLLTTLPPVDGGVLLVIPYLLGLVSGAGATTLAARLPGAAWPALVPLALLIAVILLGSQRPGEVIASAAAFFVVALAWLVTRSRRSGIAASNPRKFRAITASVALVGIAAGVGVVSGPRLLGADPDRYVLRTKIVPPFDINKYPSPLASYRRYRPGYQPTAASLAKTELFTVHGLPSGTFLRIAALDAYDGTVWAASNSGAKVGGVLNSYQRVGTQLTTDLTGPSTGPVTVTVNKAYADPGAATPFWIPTVGSLTSIRFSSPPAEERADKLRYNLATQTAILPDGLRAGDTYTFTAVGAHEDEAKSSMTAEPTGATVDQPSFQPVATKLAAGSGSAAMDQVLRVAAQLQGGVKAVLSDSAPGFPAGHSLFRLSQFAQYDHQLMVGDGEQYAALMALLANELGVPARVVFGAQLDGTVVHGSDIQAAVELQLSNGHWVYLPQSRFTPTNTTPPPRQQSTTETPKPAQPVPQPMPLRAPASATNPLDDGTPVFTHSKQSTWATILHWIWVFVKYVGIPLALVLGLCWLIVAAKSRRARRRRTRGEPAQRLVAAWSEYLDRTRDHGFAAPPIATRREQAAAIPVDGGGQLAIAADIRIFGAEVPDEPVAADYWAEVDHAIKRLREGLPLWRRFVVALHPVSLVPRRWRESAARASRTRGRR